MQRHRSAAGDSAVRPVRKFRLALASYRRIILPILLVLTVLSSGLIGYLLGNDKPALAAPVSDAASVAAFGNQLSEQDNICAAVEQINLQQQLAQAKQKSDEMANSLENQQKQIDGLEQKILNALMANLTDKLISRSSPTVSSYAQEAKNLITLSRKLSTFSKTSEASEIDLSTYKAAIDKRLMYLPTLRPIPGVYDGYGWRIHPIYHNRQFHPAADVGAARGTPIKAAASGTVTASTYGNGSGYYVEISHGNGFSTTYMHCSKLYVKAGQRVTKGDVIAAVGSTGTSTDPHLHYEIRLNGNPLNPRLMIME